MQKHYFQLIWSKTRTFYLALSVFDDITSLAYFDYDEFCIDYLPCKRGFDVRLSKFHHGIFESNCSCISVPILMDACWIYFSLWRCVATPFQIMFILSRTRVRLSLASIENLICREFLLCVAHLLNREDVLSLTIWICITNRFCWIWLFRLDKFSQ